VASGHRGGPVGVAQAGVQTAISGIARAARHGFIAADRVFVGFGAGAEEELFRRYLEADKRSVQRLGLFDLGSFARLHRVSLRPALTSLLSTLRAARLAVRLVPADLENRRLDFLTWIASRSAWYAYTRVWFRDCGAPGPARIREAAFLSADTSAFAAVDAGLRTVYMQHGMLRGVFCFQTSMSSSH